MVDSTGEKNLKIAFMGTSEYRKMLQSEALKRGVKVQGLIENAIALYLGKSRTEAAVTMIPDRKSIERGWQYDALRRLLGSKFKDSIERLLRDYDGALSQKGPKAG